MTNLKKLSIKGIRCFSPHTSNTIEFLNPLTLILGVNGSGKTTIIECLKYICTGSLPLNTKNGASFIFDPNLINQSDIKAQIKLTFKNIKNQQITCSRSMQLSLKKNKTEVRTLENVLSVGEGENKSSFSNKCAETDKEMIYHLGVNSALLENVIFCHQEDSVWILDDPKIVKKRMDDIFASTKYIKALENLKIQKREISSELKLKKQELEFLYQQKIQKDKLILKIQETNEKILELEEKNKIYQIENEKCLEIKTEIKKEIKRLEELEKDFREIKLELKNLENFVTDFPYEIFTEEKLCEINLINLNILEEELKMIENNFLEINDKLNLKKNEKEEYFLMKQKKDFYIKNNEICYEKIKEINICKKETIKNFYEECVENYSEFFTSEFKNFLHNFLEENNLEETENMFNLQKNEKISNFKECKIVELKEFNKNFLNLIKNKISLLKSEEKTLNQKNDDFNEKIINFNLELKYINEQINELSFYDFKELENLTLEEIENKIKENKNEEFLCAYKELQKEIPVLENKFYEKYEENINLQIKQKRKLELEVLLDKLVFGMLKHFISNEEYSSYNKYELMFYCEKNKLEKIIKEENNLKMEREEKKLKEKYFKLEKNKKIEELKCKIKENIKEIEDFNIKNEFENNLEILNLLDFSNLEHKLHEIEENIIAVNNSSLIFNSLKNKGIKNSECPLCIKQMNKNELKIFISKIEENIFSIPETLKEKKREKIELEEKILGIKNKNILIKQRNDLIYNYNKFLEELKTYVSFNSLKHFLEDEEFFSEDFSSENTSIFELEERFTEIKESEIFYFEYLNLEKELKNKKIFDSEELKNEIHEKKLFLKNLQTNLESENKKLEDLKEKKKKLIKKKEIEEKINNFKNKEKFKEELEMKINILENNQNTTINTLQSLRKKLESLNLIYNSAWESIMRLENLIQSYFNECDSIMKEILRNEEFLENLTIISFNEKEYTNLENNFLKIKENYEKKKENFLEKQKLKMLAQENIKLKENKKKINFFKNKLQNDESEKLEILKEKYENLNDKFIEMENKKSMNLGELNQLKEIQSKQEKEVKIIYEEIDFKFLQADTSFKILEIVIGDLEKAIKSVDKSIIEFHSKKIEEVNKSLKTLWMNTYKGNDIDSIELKAESVDQKSYNYKLVMIKNNTELEMRSRSSAGQKIICSILFRLALVEAFSKDCSFLALDEPTTNLDESNVESLANTLSEIIEQKRNDSFQIIIITHDEKFVSLLTRQSVDEYYQINRKRDGSVIELKSV